ncbi:MAG: chemotaxis-specific protein-glutamate methyltransferase CheB, partial [Nitrospinota bacterium]
MERRFRGKNNKPVKVLIVDDSPLVRNILTLGLGIDEEIKVLGAAPDPYVARDMIIELNPDVLTLDVEMPKMNGVEFLKRLMPQYPIAVVMVSALTLSGKKITIEALEAGAVDFVSKPSANLSHGLNSMLFELREKIKTASKANLSKFPEKSFETSSSQRKEQGQIYRGSRKVIAVGASTGGTQAIKCLLSKLPENAPGMVIVQHMPAGFTKIFSDRLNEQCRVRVKEAENGDLIRQGTVLIAPGGFHLSVAKSADGFLVRCQKGEPVNGHCPSVDVLMHSVAKNIGA